MSCERCNVAQEERGPELGRHAYVRVGNGNVELVGCPDHVAELVELIQSLRLPEVQRARQQVTQSHW